MPAVTELQIVRKVPGYPSNFFLENGNIVHFGVCILVKKVLKNGLRKH